ncbi:MAG: hypothetical protein KDA85_07865 [Planctomycetaceae bacterium]|nr:hypothetical protein [Planctomycetaceae bacterium]
MTCPRYNNVACCLLLSVAVTGCGDRRQSQEPPVPAVSAEAVAFDDLLQVSVRELQDKNEAHKAWGLGTFDRWNINQDVGDLVFTNADGTQAVAPAQIIGSFNTNDNSWLWSWDNPSIAADLKTDATKLREYGEQHGIEKLTTRKWTGTEEDAWAMAAFAVKHCGAQGAYRGQSGATWVFMVFGGVKVSKPTVGN